MLTGRNFHESFMNSSKMSLDEIVEGLYIGDANDAIRLLEEAKATGARDPDGVAVIVNVADRVFYSPFNDHFELMMFPIDDHGRTDLNNKIHEIVVFIQTAMNRGDKVLVHCHAGVNRSAIACTASVEKFSP